MVNLKIGKQAQESYNNTKAEIFMGGVPESFINPYIQKAVDRFGWTIVIFEQIKIGNSNKIAKMTLNVGGEELFTKWFEIKDSVIDKVAIGLKNNIWHYSQFYLLITNTGLIWKALQSRKEFPIPLILLHFVYSHILK